MKKIFILTLIIFLTAQSIHAQVPALVYNFSINSNTNSAIRLAWTVANNEVANNFEVERSQNGKDFNTVAAIMATEKTSTENYTYADTQKNNDKVMYRLKLISKSHRSYYSKIITVQAKVVNNNNIRIIGNPVKDQLTFNFNSTIRSLNDLKIYNLSGNIVLNQKINIAEGATLINISLNANFNPGIYVVEMNNGITTQTEKFVKQ
jgi:hypothetical protein